MDQRLIGDVVFTAISNICSSTEQKIQLNV